MGEIKHGTVGAYTNHACRCKECRAANRRSHQSRREQRQAERVMVGGRLIAPLPDEYHGRPSTYAYHGCRCRDCVGAHREMIADLRRQRRDVA